VAMTARMYDELQVLWQKSNQDLSVKVFTMRIFRVSFYTACRIAGIPTGGNAARSGQIADSACRQNSRTYGNSNDLSLLNRKRRNAEKRGGNF